ncbi:P-loop NTPase fold protein [Agaribacter marinus]|uniref:KAP NTPase domain-containing protein n=1 Tax=Agaribacter marinus TaxID=1431249 RepID=A0AA37T0G6_9ALTE|nr:P-loop NTPase fold protein [Agaribacter marinus]GLR71619.1 hypothetical protein GCM10007852_25270 [Agaribacter marinus]
MEKNGQHSRSEEYSSSTSIYNDEPDVNDQLDRVELAKAFSELVDSCETPLVIGIFGTWGAGKTTFLKLVEQHFAEQSTHSVWFNAWEHDQDDAPAVSLLHATVDSLGLNQEFKHSLSQVALAFGSVLLKKTTTLSIDNVEKVKKILDEESFRVREARAKLQSHFKELLKKAADKGHGRIVFFIDDLDRCSPECVVRVLSSIKLYFNVPNCVFFLGIDRETIEHAINTETGKSGSSNEAKYLDKMVQLPFSLPPISEKTFETYITALLPDDLLACSKVLFDGLDRNPRSVKRFINNLILRHKLALNLKISNYDPQLLALLLLFEQAQPALFRELAQNQSLLLDLHQNDEKARDKIESKSIRKALANAYVSEFARLTNYFSLANLDVAMKQEKDESLDLSALAKAHGKWLKSVRQKGQKWVEKGVNFTEQNFDNMILREADFTTALMNNSSFRKADLRRARLAGATLQHADFTAANLREADLREADLVGANLHQADLNNCNLTRTNLRGANLRKTIGLSYEQIKKSLIDSSTQLPLPLATKVAKQNDNIVTRRAVKGKPLQVTSSTSMDKTTPVKSMSVGAKIKQFFSFWQRDF